MKLGIDLSKFDASYTGGVATFALGLTQGLLRSLSPSDRIVLLATRENRDDLTRRFGRDNVSVVEIDDGSFVVWRARAGR